MECFLGCKPQCPLVGWVQVSVGVAAVREYRMHEEHLPPLVVCRCTARTLPLDEDPQYLRTIADASEHDNNLPDLLERQLRCTRTRSAICMGSFPFVAAVPSSTWLL